jgi:hypothetical protein
MRLPLPAAPCRLLPPPFTPTCRVDLFWLLERIMPRLHERTGSNKPVHILGIADPNSIPQVCCQHCQSG